MSKLKEKREEKLVKLNENKTENKKEIKILYLLGRFNFDGHSGLK